MWRSQDKLRCSVIPKYLTFFLTTLANRCSIDINCKNYYSYKLQVVENWSIQNLLTKPFKKVNWNYSDVSLSIWVFSISSCLLRGTFQKCLQSIFKEKTVGHNWALQPFSQDYDLASHTIYLSYLPFHGNFLFALRVFARNLLGVCRRLNILYFFPFRCATLQFEPWPPIF